MTSTETSINNTYAYYKDVCEYLLIKPFSFKYFQIGDNKHQLINTFTYRWLYDINHIYRQWHVDQYNSVYKTSGYQYTTLQDNNIIKGLELLKYAGHLDLNTFKQCNDTFEQIINDRHPYKYNTPDNIKIITYICSAIEYLSNHINGDYESNLNSDSDPDPDSDPELY